MLPTKENWNEHKPVAKIDNVTMLWDNTIWKADTNKPEPTVQDHKTTYVYCLS